MNKKKVKKHIPAQPSDENWKTYIKITHPTMKLKIN
jgi:hypothetical protein